MALPLPLSSLALLSDGASSGCLLGAGLAFWADAVEGKGWRTKNWRGLSRMTNMLVAGLLTASELPLSSSSCSAGLELNLHILQQSAAYSCIQCMAGRFLQDPHSTSCNGCCNLR